MPQGGIPAENHSVAIFQLMTACAKRIRAQPPPPHSTSLRFPIAFLFARGDRGGDAEKIAQQAIASFEYWDKASGDALDLIYAGWRLTEGRLMYTPSDFLAFRDYVEAESEWEYSGETDLLVLNFEIWPDAFYGMFDYSQVVVLRLEAMLRDKHIGSIDGFMAELIRAAEKVKAKPAVSASSPVWEISDSIGIIRARKSIWEAVKEYVLGKNATFVSALENFAVRDLSTINRPRRIRLPSEKLPDIERILDHQVSRFDW